MMKRSDAARYARWSAAIAVAIVLFAVAAYMRRQHVEKGERRAAPPPVPADVEQQSSQFAYSKVIGNRTLFSIRASRATEYKDQNRSALQDVLITLYGHNADRNDTISAHQCTYLPATGHIQCQGEVQIDLRNAHSSSTVDREMHLETRNISFDPATETVSTPNAIMLQIPGGQGQANGVEYDTRNETVEFENGVQLQLSQVGGRLSSPIYLKGSSLVYRGGAKSMELSGPVTAQEGSARLYASTLELRLDSQMLPNHIVATHGVKITNPPVQGSASFSAKRVDMALGSTGAVERIAADGAVHLNQKTGVLERSFSAEHIEFSMLNREGRNQPREMQARGNILAESREGDVARRLETASLDLEFSPRGDSRDARITNASTQTEGLLTAIQPARKDVIRAGKFSAEFNSDGKLERFVGSEGAETTRQIGNESQESTSAQTLVAVFSGANDWTTVEEAGDVEFDRGDHRAAANHAEISRAANEIVLDGNARVGDPSSSTSAAHIEMNQSSGEMHAIGSVVSTYVGTAEARPPALGTGIAHVSADRLDASNSSGSETYSGHARLWLNGAVLDSDTIEIWRGQKRLQAHGSVHAVIPEAPSPTEKSKTPILWRVIAPNLDYWSAAGKIDLTGGVQAQSSTGSLSGDAIEFLIAPDSRNQQRLQRAIVDGNVEIRSNGHVGTAERGEYTSRDGKFVLSGGQPKLSDASGNITTGRELTFFLANDTILVDSQKGSRTVTKHRVEK